MKPPLALTEEGNRLKYEKEYFIVYFKNHEFLKGTENERKLFFVYTAIFHTGCGINTFGMKIFKNKINAQKYCDENNNN